MRNRLGFTFIETIVYLAIVSIVLVSIIGFSQRIISSRNKARTMEEVQQNVRFAWERLSQDMRNASSAEVDGGVLHLVQGADNVYYQVTDGQLTRKEESTGAEVALTTEQLEVEDFTVTGLNDQAYKIDLQIRYKNPNNWPEYDWDIDLSTTINLRNAD